MRASIAAAILSLGMVTMAPCVLPAEEIPRAVAAKPWTVDQRGYHRAIAGVEAKSDAVRVHIPWRRRDQNAAAKNIVVVDAATGQAVGNVVRVEINREAGDLVFQPQTAPGDYEIYYLPFPWQDSIGGGYYGRYVAPKDTADPAWVERNHLKAADMAAGAWKSLPEAKVKRIEARTEFDRFDPMEVVATREELRGLLAKYPDPYLVFPEDRRYPIRMTDDLPVCWIEKGPSGAFSGSADRKEYYVFQIGLYAAKQPLSDLRVEFTGLAPQAGAGGAAIPASSMTCFNVGGTNWDGSPLVKTVNVPQGKVQALWMGVQIPETAAPGTYAGKVTIRPSDAPAKTVDVAITVGSAVLADSGDGELWRHSRLRWLNSTLGTDDDIVAPYTPLEIKGRTVRCLGRDLTFNALGLPQSIRVGAVEILSAPIAFVIETDQGPIVLKGDEPRLTKKARGVVTWECAGSGEGITLESKATMEFDGHVDFRFKVSAAKPLSVRDIRLEIPLTKEASEYMMGIGRSGGKRLAAHDWKWTGPYDSLWVGGVHAGLHCELRGGAYHGPLLNLYHPAPPASWHNGGQGGVSVNDAGEGALVKAYSGKRSLAAGESLIFEFALLVTPVKPLDTASHFRARYYHDSASPAPGQEAIAAGVNVINVHHANPVNPYINYPFVATGEMTRFVKEQHAAGRKVKIYYTIREITNYVAEIFALRSLGDEILQGGGDGGFPWLREHLDTGYTPSWFHPYSDGTADASIVTSGASRWYNYYIEGLGWLTKNVGIDGLYLDDVSYDRRVLKRMRKVMERNQPGCIMDLHSNTGFSIGPANQYAEFFPYVDRLWFGESFNYNAMPPDQWLVEVSGIPFGLMGEMLQAGGNQWLGPVFGMTNRLGWSTENVRPDPRHVWKVWDSFGIVDAKMIGYWEKDCPARTSDPSVFATAYVKKGKTLIAVGNWAESPVECRLTLDWKRLGMDPAKARLHAPAVETFQEEKAFQPGDTIPIASKRGWLLIVD